MNVADILRERFVKVNSEYQNATGSKLYAEESKLRIEIPLQAGVGRYQFNIKKTDITNQREVSLDRNDVFIPNFMGLFIGIQDNSTPSAEVLSSYPLYNDGTNPSPYPVGFLNKDIEALYNGKFVWLIDNGILFSSFPTERFRKVPQTQGAFVLDSTDAAVNENIIPEWDIRKASEMMIPKLTIAGTRDHNISVNFDASGLTFPVTTDNTPVLVLYMDGFLVKGGCEFYDQKNPNAAAVGQW